MKMNIAGVEYEGSPQELKELFDLLSDTEFEESKEEYRKVVRSPREGDYVKFNESDDDDITVGKYYEITTIDDDGDAVFIDDGGSVNWALKALFDEGEFEFFEKVAHAPKFEVGDYIVALPAADEEYSYTNTDMKLGKVVEICGDGGIKIEVVRHENDSYEGQTFDVDPRLFRKATEAEKEEVIFTRAGRKPGEFKPGDIVSDRADYTVLTVLTGIEIRQGRVQFQESIVRNISDIKLVAPVESRVDL